MNSELRFKNGKGNYKCIMQNAKENYKCKMQNAKFNMEYDSYNYIANAVGIGPLVANRTTPTTTISRRDYPSSIVNYQLMEVRSKKRYE